jgi:hypothetical protein
VGNLFRPVLVELPWSERNGGSGAPITRTIYDERRFGDLPVLADALEESGGEVVLSHCRSKVDHVRATCLGVLLSRPVIADRDDDTLTPWTVRSPIQ